MSERTDEELIRIVTTERKNYQPLALDAAEQEISKRNIDTSNFEAIKLQAIKEKEQKISIETDTVGSDTRFVHYLIDGIASYVLIFIGFTFSALVLPLTDDDAIFIFTLFLLLGGLFGYYFLMEMMFQKTLGKFITKTKVVNKNGEKPTTGELVLRTFCRFIPFDNFSFMFTKNGFHDYLSSTKVIRDHKK
nr:RDD family protein [uncultured Allomuricauda sp.]